MLLAPSVVAWATGAGLALAALPAFSQLSAVLQHAPAIRFHQQTNHPFTHAIPILLLPQLHTTIPLKTSLRSFSSSSTSSSRPHELLASKCRVLPFSLSRSDADAEWTRHHAGTFTARPTGGLSAKSVLLPFWCISGEAIITVRSAQIGRTHWATRYNSATRRLEPRLEVEWTTVQPNWRYSRRWGPDATEGQVYGGSKYRHDPALERMAPGEHVRRALKYDEYVRHTDDQRGRSEVPERLFPFRLGPSEALEAARRKIRSSEVRVAEQQLLRSYGGDRVQLAVVEVELAAPTATPVFVPVHVFKSRVRGTALRTYVAGFTAGVSFGPVLPNPTRLAAAAAVVAPTVLLVAGLSVPGGLWLGAGLSWLLGYGVASYWPELHATWLRARASLQPQLRDTPTEEEEAWWRHEWVRQDLDDGYGYSDDGRYSYSYSRGRQQQGGNKPSGGGTAPGGDPRGYYRLLGVSPGCSTLELQAAFRAAALKWHPDRQPDPTLKAEATRRFQAAQGAYTVLRDPARRAAYDRGH